MSKLVYNLTTYFTYYTAVHVVYSIGIFVKRMLMAKPFKTQEKFSISIITKKR